MLNVNQYLSQFNDVTIILISLAIMLFGGFLMTRITKRLKFPEVTGYIISGILMGPYVLNLIPTIVIENMGFVGDIALAFIAFDVGKFLKKDVLKKSGLSTVVITLFESVIAGIMITLLMRYIFSFDWSFSLLLGAIATATAPASTMMTINEYDADGPFVNTLLQVVALDDVVCLILFSVASAVVSAMETGQLASSDVILPILYNIGALILGFLLGLLLIKLLAPDTRSDSNRLILVITMLLIISGLCAIVNISPLLACMVFGATYINRVEDEQLYEEINVFTPPIMSLFFVLSGISLDLQSLVSLGLVGVAYFIVRMIGKYIGAYLGGLVTNVDKSIRDYLGFALIPQAGVAIGLAFLGQRMLPPAIGNKLLTIILASSVLYELIGPIAAKWSLFKSGAIDSDKK